MTSQEIQNRKAFHQHTDAIALYGAGTVGRDVVRLLSRLGFRIKFVMDLKPLSFASIEGIPILRPDDPSLGDAERKSTKVIVSIFNAYVSMGDICAKLHNLGWADVMPFFEFYQLFPIELGERYWLTNRSFYDGWQPHYREAEKIWADKKSSELYEAIIEFRLTGNFEMLPPPDSTQYFPGDLPSFDSPLRLVDCGAFDGDTIRQLRSLKIDVEAVAAFEPDAVNFEALTREIRSLSDKGDSDAMAFPCGVWSHTAQMRFDAGRGTGSLISSEGTSTIQCVALDDALPAFCPNFIKMDVEGAEYAALLGARQLITKHRPRLAICLYHSPQHLWQIPLLVKSWNLGFRFYLRCHCYNGFELVLYAVPGEDGRSLDR